MEKQCCGEWRSFDVERCVVEELQCEGFALRGSCSAGVLQCGGVAE